jgi:hypothetical protein
MTELLYLIVIIIIIIIINTFSINPQSIEKLTNHTDNANHIDNVNNNNTTINIE